MDVDLEVRLAAFKWLRDQTAAYGDVLSRELLARGFEFRGDRVPMLSPQGIFKPRILDLPLSITTSPDSPYADELDAGDFLHYRYRGTNPQHRDNVGLRKALAQRRPLIYFFGVQPGRYMAVWPVYVVGDDPATLTLTGGSRRSAAVSLGPTPSPCWPSRPRRAAPT
jgi:putative restriction endonuclease